MDSYVESLQNRIRELEAGLVSAPGPDGQPLRMQHTPQLPVTAMDDTANATADINDDGECIVDDSAVENNISQTLNGAQFSPSLDRAGIAPSTAPRPLSMSTPVLPHPSSEPPMEGMHFDHQTHHDPIAAEWAAGSIDGDSFQDSMSELSDACSLDETRSDTYIEGLDAMGVIQSARDNATGRPRRPSGYFGPSSAVSLLGDAFSAIKNRIRGPESVPSDSWDFTTAEARDESSYEPLPKQHTASCSRHYGDKASPFAGLDYIVPTRAEADQLVDSYSTWVYSLYPFIHMPSFMVRYEMIWTSAKQRQRTDLGGMQSRNPTSYYESVNESIFHCMLNLVFAMGALFNPAIALRKRDGVSRAFFNRAKALLDIDALACGSTALVQVLLLMGQYLQSTDAASSCWNVVGLAIRVSQGIGLHHEPECCRKERCAEGHHSQLEREIRRRTWTCAVILDRVLSLVYGRPMMIHPALTRNGICLPQPIDDKYLTGVGQDPGRQPPGTISLVGCYIEAVRLQDIIGQFLATTNHVGFEKRHETKTHSDPTTSWSEREDLDITSILEIEKHFIDWRRRLPGHLRVATYKDGGAASLKQDQHKLMILERQANVLLTRYLHARATLVRPALSILCAAPAHSSDYGTRDDPVAGSVKQEVIIKAANMCLSTTEALVDLITTKMNPQADRLPAPWYNVFYIHSSAIMLLLGYLCMPSLITSVNRNSLKNSFDRCVAFLRAYRPISRSARRSGRVLAVLQHQVFHQNDDVRPGNVDGPMHWQAEPLQGNHKEDRDRAALDNPTQPQDILLPNIPSGDTLYQPGSSWTGDTNDMNWLSLVPFWDDFGHGTMT